MKGGSLLCLLALALLFVGCAGPRTQLMTEVRTELAGSQSQKAYSVYKQRVGQTQRVDELLNLGLLAFEAGDYEASFSAFSEAERLSEERETKSLSREAAGIALSDRVRAYQGTVFDKAMLHYYRSLGFVARNDLSAATVEGRAIATYLEVNARESKHTYKDDGFLQWFSGSLYDAFGQTNDAWISYKRAREIYSGFYGLPEPSFLCPLTLSAARRVGDPESVQELAQQCPDSTPADWGRVIVLCELGLAPPILEENIMLPIYKNDPHDFDDDDARDRYAYEVLQRRGRHDYDDVELDYLLRVALPYYSSDYIGTSVAQVVIRDTTEREILTDPVQNIGAILRQDLSDRGPSIFARAVTRALIKYAATKAAEKAGGKKDKLMGDILGTVVNIAGAATEAADTRSWETLPDRICAADFRLPPGTHSLRALFKDDLGGILFRHDFPTIEVKSGDVVFLRARCMR